MLTIAETRKLDLAFSSPIFCNVTVLRAYLELCIERPFTDDEWQEILHTRLGHKD